jgi:hypothetical protein
MNNKEWSSGTVVIVILLAAIGEKLHAFDGLFAPTNWVMTIALIAGFFIVWYAVMFIWWLLSGLYRGWADAWTGVPEWARFLHGIVLVLLIASTAFYFVYHGIP